MNCLRCNKPCGAAKRCESCANWHYHDRWFEVACRLQYVSDFISMYNTRDGVDYANHHLSQTRAIEIAFSARRKRDKARARWIY